MPDLADWISLGISVAAFVVSAVTAWWTLGRPGNLVSLTGNIRFHTTGPNTVVESVGVYNRGARHAAFDQVEVDAHGDTRVHLAVTELVDLKSPEAPLVLPALVAPQTHLVIRIQAHNPAGLDETFQQLGVRFLLDGQVVLAISIGAAM